MYWRDVVKLIAVNRTKSENGYLSLTVKSELEVFADVQSVKRSEFYAAKQSGIDIAIVFLMRAAEYNEQEYVRYKDVLYKVERAYTKDGEIIELNCSKSKETVK